MRFAARFFTKRQTLIRGVVDYTPLRLNRVIEKLVGVLFLANEALPVYLDDLPSDVV